MVVLAHLDVQNQQSVDELVVLAFIVQQKPKEPVACQYFYKVVRVYRIVQNEVIVFFVDYANHLCLVQVHLGQPSEYKLQNVDLVFSYQTVD